MLVSHQCTQARGAGSFQSGSEPLAGPSDASGPRSCLGLTLAPGGLWYPVGGTEISPQLLVPFTAPLAPGLETSVKVKKFLDFP